MVVDKNFLLISFARKTRKNAVATPIKIPVSFHPHIYSVEEIRLADTPLLPLSSSAGKHSGKHRVFNPKITSEDENVEEHAFGATRRAREPPDRRT